MNQNKNLRFFCFEFLILFNEYLNFTNNQIHIILKNSWNVFNNIRNINSIFHFIIKFLNFKINVETQLRKITLKISYEYVELLI